MTDKKIARILDANLNRAREGLRVCEEIVRFVQDDKRGASKFKKIRHSLQDAASELRIQYKDLLESRNSTTDVGKDQVIYKSKKSTPMDIFVSNMKRAQEAVRVLEEFSKLKARKASTAFQGIRFNLYTLEKQIVCTLF